MRLAIQADFLVISSVSSLQAEIRRAESMQNTKMA